MSDIRDLYQELILDHSSSPRNFGKIEKATHSGDGHNPLCGDKINLFLVIQDSKLVDIKFNAKGCAISIASASMMTEILMGKTIREVESVYSNFHSLVTGNDNDVRETIGQLEALAGVKEYPMRVKCATLAWHTVKVAMERKEQIVSTE
tara:strand:- start:223 stop:669 length:447 start_codon:yes stop_codon:yes gene_type:complete